MEKEDKIKLLEEELEKTKKESFVYLLESTSGTTYVGATVDLDHRLRQHNMEIKGGAVATSIKVKRGETWKRVLYIKNFPDWKAALQFEWKFKQLTRKIINKYPSKKPLDRRLEALNELLQLEKPTTKSILFSQWNVPPEVIYETKQI
jgi:structure-specific endonuclease subunit SLX1